MWLFSEKDVDSDILEILSSVSKKELIKIILDKKQERGIPSNIFKYDLSGLEAIVKYLREHRKLGFNKIGMLLKRNPKSLSSTYHKAATKRIEPFPIEKTEVIPFSAFVEHLSILEAVCVFLNNTHNKTQIANLLGKDPRTVWTVINRAKKKSEVKP